MGSGAGAAAGGVCGRVAGSISAMERPLTHRSQATPGVAHRRMTCIKSRCAFGHKKPPPVGAVGEKWRVGCPATGTERFAVSRESTSSRAEVGDHGLESTKGSRETDSRHRSSTGRSSYPAYCRATARSAAARRRSRGVHRPDGWKEEAPVPHLHGHLVRRRFRAQVEVQASKDLRSRLDYPAVALLPAYTNPPNLIKFFETREFPVSNPKVVLCLRKTL